MTRGRTSDRAVESGIDIAASPEVVFDYVTDILNEPQWNPQMSDVEKLTEGSLRVGSRFAVRFGRGVGPAVIEYTAFDRPHTWAATSTSRALHADAQGRVTPTPGGCRLVMRTHLQPRGPLRALAPVLQRSMQRIWDDDVNRIKDLLEHAPVRGGRRVTEARPVDRVPVADLCALWAETGSAPMNIALIGSVDGAGLAGAGGSVDLARLRSFVESRLDRAPMLRRRLRRARPGEGGPTWVDAADFAIADHVVLAPAEEPLVDEKSFLDWCANRSVISLDRTRPLWRLDVVPGLPHGRIGVMLVLHHVVADGLRGVDLVAALLDPTPEPGRTVTGPWHPAPAPGSPDLVRDNLRRRWCAIRGLRPVSLVRRARTLRALAREPARRAPATSLTGDIGSRRRLVVLGYPLEALRAGAHSHGCTINELLLAAVTGGLRDLLASRGELRAGLVLRASVPVGARAGRDGGIFIAPLPVTVADPLDRLHLIAESTRARKARAQDGVAGLVSMPPLLARLGVAWARRTAAAHINLYVSNVPGPRSPLYLAGSRLMDAVPLAPLVAGVRLSVTALSYDGRFRVSLLGDDSIPDLDLVSAAMERDLSILMSAHVRPADPGRRALSASPDRPRGSVSAAGHRAAPGGERDVPDVTVTGSSPLARRAGHPGHRRTNP